MERYRTTLIMLGVLLVLGALAIFLNNRSNSSDLANGTPTPVSQYVWQDDNQVTGIDVMSGTNKVSLKKDVVTTVWQITEPVKTDADTFAVGNEADSLKSLQATSVLTDSSDLKQYGLDKPAMSATMIFSDTKSTKRTILVGTTTFDGAGYYVKTPDTAKVYVVANTTIEPLRSWLTTPPVNPPTPTVVPITIVPTSAVTSTATITATVGPSPPPVAHSPTVPITSTNTISSTTAITSTSPGAANATTPVESPVLPTATVSP